MPALPGPPAHTPDMAGRLGQPTFVESTTQPAELPLDWTAAKQRLTNARPT